MKRGLPFIVFVAGAALASRTEAHAPEAAPSRDLTTAARAINALGLDLLRHGIRASSNAVISPYSIQNASAMVYAGAAGKTHDEMALALHYPDDEARLHGAFAALTRALERLTLKTSGRVPQGANGRGRADPITIAIANRLFAQKDFGFRAPFLALLKDTYRSPLALVDFAGNPTVAIRRINDWVAEQTRERIRDLIPPDSLGSDTRLVLVNAIHLNAPWERAFYRGGTSLLPFAVNGGEPVDVPTMQVQSNLGYQSHKTFTTVVIPYSHRDLQFLVLLPDNGVSLDRLEAQLTPDQLSSLARSPAISVFLYLPKFKIEPPTKELSRVLAQLGMKSAFQPAAADFRRMTAEDHAYVSGVFHRASLAIDENGTEATAATAYSVRAAASIEPPAPKELHVDRPFLFAIQHRPSGACLFLGRVMDPR
jgi:serpin B